MPTTQFNAEAKTMAKENAMKGSPKAYSIEQNAKSKHTRPDKFKNRAAQASIRPYKRVETQVREPNVTGIFSPLIQFCFYRSQKYNQ